MSKYLGEIDKHTESPITWYQHFLSSSPSNQHFFGKRKKELKFCDKDHIHILVPAVLDKYFQKFWLCKAR